MEQEHNLLRTRIVAESRTVLTTGKDRWNFCGFYSPPVVRRNNSHLSLSRKPWPLLYVNTPHHSDCRFAPWTAVSHISTTLLSKQYWRPVNISARVPCGCGSQTPWICRSQPSYSWSFVDPVLITWSEEFDDCCSLATFLTILTYRSPKLENHQGDVNEFESTGCEFDYSLCSCAHQKQSRYSIRVPHSLLDSLSHIPSLHQADCSGIHVPNWCPNLSVEPAGMWLIARRDSPTISSNPWQVYVWHCYDALIMDMYDRYFIYHLVNLFSFSSHKV